MMKRIVVSLMLLGVALLATAAPQAEATSINAELLAIVGTGPYTWIYLADLNGASRVEAGDYFSIFDWAGLVAGSDFAPTTDWAFSNPTTTPCPVFQNCSADDPAMGNLMWTYTGLAPIIVPGPLGLFGADSTFNSVGLDQLVAQDTHHEPLATSDGTAQGNSQQIEVAVPEPSSLLLLGGGLLGTWLVARRRRT
jgi:hypothetical protein